MTLIIEDKLFVGARVVSTSPPDTKIRGGWDIGPCYVLNRFVSHLSLGDANGIHIILAIFLHPELVRWYLDTASPSTIWCETL